MVTVRIENFSLAQICRSGQCFRMRERGEDTYEVIARDRYLEILQNGTECTFHCSEDEFKDFWCGYFDLEEVREKKRESDQSVFGGGNENEYKSKNGYKKENGYKNEYASCISRINPNDSYLQNAAAFGSGIRILRQDLWEMIVSFLISQQNNIVRIRRCIRNICEKYGEKKMNARGEIYYAFPKPEDLARLGEDDLKACNLGYRSKYVVRAAKNVVSGTADLEAISHMRYRNAREELLKLYGVGEKVADCICLFSLHHLQAFPVDTHINQAMQKHYKRGFPNRRYQGFQGVMQQYIFYYELLGGREED